MAALVGTVSTTNPQIQTVPVGNLKGRLVTVTFDDGTDAGGASLTPADVGLSEILFVAVSPDAGDNGAVVGGGHVFQYNYVTQALQAFEEEGVAAGGPLLEVDHSLEDVQVRLFILGL